MCFLINGSIIRLTNSVLVGAKTKSTQTNRVKKSEGFMTRLATYFAVKKIQNSSP